jgi:hypothetical protein
MAGLIKFFDALALIPMFILGFVLVAALGEKPEPPVVEAAAVETPAVETALPATPAPPAMLAVPIENAALIVEPSPEVGQTVMGQPNKEDSYGNLQ